MNFYLETALLAMSAFMAGMIIHFAIKQKRLRLESEFCHRIYLLESRFGCEQAVTIHDDCVGLLRRFNFYGAASETNESFESIHAKSIVSLKRRILWMAIRRGRLKSQLASMSQESINGSEGRNKHAMLVEAIVLSSDRIAMMKKDLASIRSRPPGRLFYALPFLAVCAILD